MSTVAAVIIPSAFLLPWWLSPVIAPRYMPMTVTQYQFKSGIFSGAIYSSLEKTDYLPLENLKDVNGKYMFQGDEYPTGRTIYKPVAISQYSP